MKQTTTEETRMIQAQQAIESKEVQGEQVSLVEQTTKSGNKIYEVIGTREGFAGATLYGEFGLDKEAALDFFQSL